MRNLFLAIMTMMFMSVCQVFAADNFLNAVVLEGTGSGYNVILRSDAIAAVKRTVENPDKIILSIKGLTLSDNLTTLYRNTSSTNGIVVENTGNKEVQIQIQGNGVSKSNIIFDSPASAPVIVPDKISRKTIGWSVFALLALCMLFAKSKNIKVESREKIDAAVRKKMRDREIAMYKNYRRELLTKPSIDYKIKNPRIQQAIRQADTIRHLQRTSQR
jgi:hypothetical protein